MTSAYILRQQVMPGAFPVAYSAEAYIAVVGLTTSALAISAAQALGTQRAGDGTITANYVTGPNYAADTVLQLNTNSSFFTNHGGTIGYFKVVNVTSGSVSAEIYAGGFWYPTQAAAIAAVQAQMLTLAGTSPAVSDDITLQGLAG